MNRFFANYQRVSVPQKEQGCRVEQHHWGQCSSKPDVRLRLICSCTGDKQSVEWRNFRPEPNEGDEEDQDVCPESLRPLGKSIVQLASDLRDSYLTSIGSISDFEAQVLCCETLDEIVSEVACNCFEVSNYTRRVLEAEALRTRRQHNAVSYCETARLQDCRANR